MRSRRDDSFRLRLVDFSWLAVALREGGGRRSQPPNAVNHRQVLVSGIGDAGREAAAKSLRACGVKLIVPCKTRTVGKPDTMLTVGKPDTLLLFLLQHNP